MCPCVLEALLNQRDCTCLPQKRFGDFNTVVCHCQCRKLLLHTYAVEQACTDQETADISERQTLQWSSLCQSLRCSTVSAVCSEYRILLALSCMPNSTRHIVLFGALTYTCKPSCCGAALTCCVHAVSSDNSDHLGLLYEACNTLDCCRQLVQQGGHVCAVNCPQ